jgi:RsiW-degrading membrane proteinase PrsW (M82 family)
VVLILFVSFLQNNSRIQNISRVMSMLIYLLILSIVMLIRLLVMHYGLDCPSSQNKENNLRLV